MPKIAYRKIQRRIAVLPCVFFRPALFLFIWRRPFGPSIIQFWIQKMETVRGMIQATSEERSTISDEFCSGFAGISNVKLNFS